MKVTRKHIKDARDSVNLLNPKPFSNAEDWYRHHEKDTPHFEVVGPDEHYDDVGFDTSMGAYRKKFVQGADGKPELCSCEEPDFPENQFEWISL